MLNVSGLQINAALWLCSFLPVTEMIFCCLLSNC